MFIFLYGPTLTSIYDYWKTHSFDFLNICQQCKVSAFYKLSRFVIVFLPKNKHLLILWLRSPCAVILEPKKIKSVTFSTVSLSICHEMMGPECHNVCFFECRVLSQFFHSPLSLLSRGSLVLLRFLP